MHHSLSENIFLVNTNRMFKGLYKQFHKIVVIRVHVSWDRSPVVPRVYTVEFACCQGLSNEISTALLLKLDILIFILNLFEISHASC